MKILDEISSDDLNQYFKARINIHNAHNLLRNQLLEVLKPVGLSNTQFNVLMILRNIHPKTASVNYIKDQMLYKNSDVSRLIDRLHTKKYLIRKEGKFDRRQKEIQITNIGLDVFSKINNHEEILNAKINHLTIEEVKLLNGLLDKIKM